MVRYVLNPVLHIFKAIVGRIHDKLPFLSQNPVACIGILSDEFSRTVRVIGCMNLLIESY
jgi:hypothetical protein